MGSAERELLTLFNVMNKEGPQGITCGSKRNRRGFPGDKEGVAVALKDMMKDMANAAVSQAQSAGHKMQSTVTSKP